MLTTLMSRKARMIAAPLFAAFTALCDRSSSRHREVVTIYAAGDHRAVRPRSAARRRRQDCAMIPEGATVIALGDSVYPLATPQYFASCYAPTWGRHLEHTLAVPGNHDYVNGRLTEFAKYFGEHTDPKGFSRGASAAGCSSASTGNQRGPRLTQQLAWLKETLGEQGSSAKCIAAFWHHALFSSGLHSGDGDPMRPAWQMLYDHHADVVLSGHEHLLRRFEQLNTRGWHDAEGIREFVVGPEALHYTDCIVRRCVRARDEPSMACLLWN